MRLDRTETNHADEINVGKIVAMQEIVHANTGAKLGHIIHTKILIYCVSCVNKVIHLMAHPVNVDCIAQLPSMPCVCHHNVCRMLYAAIPSEIPSVDEK